ncbi:PD-(D/E)XK nuclease-like domain-containing protein [Salipaludibacillus agaradhaerens]|uniref:PD-(D/E)XK nuclease-like domain-containing protein n=2 Tax=Salipaludibacillus agaradhaerens TaxID=76935 RepID=A0A9Q4B229_SALAG|nr:PD-(D/E)XK nuclease-like domain-containing protein [Salipaludibacillus agaradhaerens]MCR6116676.1 PD-(D/E)XK nuclease-like domain-containing protein [Salipaludibacillus agaradhaerens]
MSVSQFKSFIACEARTMYELKGQYKAPDSQALIVGSYVHSAFESPEAFAEVEEKYSDTIYKKRGGKYADFEQADRMIETIKNDRLAMIALDGEPEQMYTGNLYGIDWKIKVDSINHGKRRFSDLKTTQDLHKRYWSDKYGKFTSFVEAWDYVFQMAIYREIIKQNTGEYYTPYIVAVTKENPPNKSVLEFDPSRFDFELEYAEFKIERIKSVKSEGEKPERCEKCDFCRRTKQLSNVIEIGDLI